jgi:hypothetical protein
MQKKIYYNSIKKMLGSILLLTIKERLRIDNDKLLISFGMQYSEVRISTEKLQVQILFF